MLSIDKIILVAFFMFLIVSCEKSVNTANDELLAYQRQNFENYSHIYKQANDSIAKWRNDSLTTTQNYFYDPYQIDSTICFNADSTLLVTTVNPRQLSFKDAIMEGLEEFCGVKINNKWYFLDGFTLVFYRENYQDSITSPFTFAELSYIAHEEILRYAIIINADGTFSANEKFFDKEFDKGMWFGNSCKTNDQFDSLVIKRAGEKYNHKLDKKEIERIKLKMKRSVRPPEPPGLWFRKLISTKPFN